MKNLAIIPQTQCISLWLCWVLLLKECLPPIPFSVVGFITLLMTSPYLSAPQGMVIPKLLLLLTVSSAGSSIVQNMVLRSSSVPTPLMSWLTLLPIDRIPCTTCGSHASKSCWVAHSAHSFLQAEFKVGYTTFYQTLSMTLMQGSFRVKVSVKWYQSSWWQPTFTVASWIYRSVAGPWVAEEMSCWEKN